MSAVDRMARAIAAEFAQDFSDWEGLSDVAQYRFRALASAALAALIEGDIKAERRYAQPGHP